MNLGHKENRGSALSVEEESKLTTGFAGHVALASLGSEEKTEYNLHAKESAQEES